MTVLVRSNTDTNLSRRRFQPRSPGVEAKRDVAAVGHRADVYRP